MALPLQAEVRAAFVRFRDQHDHAALATVFDRTAQGLLLVAHHLTVPGVDAEDLVQTTFLQAIRNAHAFDASRPLEPWLLGILTNEAHNARRRATRRVDPSRLRGEPRDDPAEHAATRDEVACMQAAIEAMPEPLRSVLVLYLVHGMTPTEVAHALGHPVGSVKSWVHRGLERLRDRLPVALVAAVAVGTASASWDPLRTAVLAAARLHTGEAAVAAGAAATGHVAKHGAPWFLLAALALLASVPMWWWARPTRAPASLDSTPRMQAPGGIVADSRSPSDGTVGNSQDARLRVDGADGSLAELHLAVRWADGTPAAIGFGVAPTYVSDARLCRRDERTDASGRSRVAGLVPGSVTLALDRGLERAVELQPGSNVVDVELPVGLAVHGRVVDEGGGPVAGAMVWLSHLPRRDDGWPVATTGTDGSFTVRDAPIGGALAAFADGFVPTRATTVQGPVGSVSERMVLAFERRANTVVIEVSGATGLPVADALVQVGGSEVLLADGRMATDDCRPAPPSLHRTDASGRVLCRQFPADGIVPVYARGHGDAGAGMAWRSGQGEAVLRLALPPSRTFQGQLARVDATTVVSARPATPRRGDDAAPHWFVATARVTPDGAFQLLGVGEQALVVESRGVHGFALAERDAGSGAVAPWSATLAPGRRVTGRVRTATGESLGALRVALCASCCRHEAVLAADGTFACEGVGELAYEFVVHEPEGGPGFLLRRAGVRGGDVLDVEVPAADCPQATVRGRLVDASGRPVATAMLVAYPRAFPSRSFGTDAEGRFVVAGLPAGRFLLLGGDYPYSLVHTFDLPAFGEIDLGTLVTQALARCRVQLAAGTPRDGLEVSLCTPGTPRTMVAVARWLGPSTNVTMPAPQGEYLLELFARGTSIHQQRVTLTAAGEVVVDVPVPTGLRCVFEARLPGGDESTWMRWLVRGDGGEREMMTGPRAAGERRTWRVAAQLQPGRHRLQAIADNGMRGECEFEVAEGNLGPFVVMLR